MTTGAARGAERRWLALAVLTFARIGMGFQFQSVGAVAPLLLERLHVQNAELGILIGLFSLPGIALALPGGLLGRRFGDRRMAMVGLGLMATGSVLIGVADAFALAVAGRVLSATGAVLLNVLLTKMVADWFAGREIIWAMTILINAWPIGIGAALFILPAVATGQGVGASFLVAAVLAVLGLAAVIVLYRSPVSTAPAAGSSSILALSRAETAAVALSSLPWMLYNVGYAVMLGFVPGFLVGRGFTVAEAGGFLGFSTLLMIASVQAGGAAAQWRGRTDAIVAVGLLVAGGGLLLLPHAPAVPTLILIGALAGLPAGALVAAPTTVLRAESRGAGMGLFWTFYYIGMTGLPPLAGWVQDATQWRAAALYFAGAALLLTLLCWRMFRAFARRA